MIFQSKGRQKILSQTINFLGGFLIIFLVLVGYVFISAFTATKTSSIKSLPYDGSTANRTIALTFDDGPDEVYTRQIIAILKENEVPATFFFTGRNMLNQKDVVREVKEAGFEIGNHTFTHSTNINASPKRLSLELNVTNMILEGLTGYSAVLYRPPYLLNMKMEEFRVSYDPEKENDPLLPLAWAYDMGFVSVGVDIDSNDWRALDSEEILNTINSQIIDGGHIILLHDAARGGSLISEGTLQAIIEEYKDKGYEFVPVSELFGLEETAAMPPVNSTYAFLLSTTLVLLLTSLFAFLNLGNIVLGVLLALLIARILLVLCLKDIPGRETSKKRWREGVSVLIPAYNEAENIQATILSVLANDIEKDIIVINDGSTDKTAQKVRALQKQHPKASITLINIKNRGKAGALNKALSLISYDVFVTIDADTIIEKNAIQQLTGHFCDKSVGAVAGKINVVLSSKLISFFQKIEYLTGQNLDKKAFNVFGAIGIVPGAIGAWKTSVVRECGGYSKETLVEDQDLTFAVLAAGHRVVYEGKGIAYTEVPNSLSSFIKQRLRWVFGTMQCLWKYKRYTFNPSRKVFGLVVMPMSAMFNVFLPLMFPLVDVVAIVLFFLGGWLIVLKAYIFFTILDILYTAHALMEEGKKDWLLIFLVPLQRLYYRPVMYYVAIKSFIKVLGGVAVTWDKLDRIGSTQLYYKTILGENISPKPGLFASFINVIKPIGTNQ